MKIRLFARGMMAILLGFGILGIGSTFGASGYAFAADQAADAAAVANPTGEATLTTAAKTTAKPAKPAKKQLKAFKKASADFSLELFQRCVAAKGKNANVTIAPMSVMTALAIAANGASGRTGSQMRSVLGDGASIAQINANLAWYNSRLANSGKAKLDSANAIWYDNGGGLKVRRAFLNVAKKYYNALVEAADFSDPATVDSINAWVAQQTRDMIKRVIDRLDSDDCLIIVNALYFDAEWKVPYEKDSVHKATFTASNGKKRTVSMMYGTEHTYLEGKGYTGFIKPYAKGYSYVALLPDEGMSLKKFVSKLDGNAFRRILSKTSDATVRTALPKYSLSYSNEHMQEQLIAMGMPLAFSTAANFKKMGISAKGDLYLGSVIHKTKIDLDEQGTKAAAVTAISVKANAMPGLDSKTVYLDRPFVYAIVDNTTKLPVFIGTVNDIKK